MVFALKCAMTCEFRKGPLRGSKLSYQFQYGLVSIVTMFGSLFVARHVQWMACCAQFFRMWVGITWLCHLCWKIIPIGASNSLSSEWGMKLFECGVACCW